MISPATCAGTRAPTCRRAAVAQRGWLLLLRTATPDTEHNNQKLGSSKPLSPS
jgi:hypothetical protein